MHIAALMLFYDNDDGDIIVIAVTDAAVDDLLAHNRFLWHTTKIFAKQIKSAPCK